jgi:hypothetical protein
MAVGGRWHLLPLSFLVILFFFLEPGSSASLPPNDQILSTFSSSSFPTLPSHRAARDGCPQPPPCQQPTSTPPFNGCVPFIYHLLCTRGGDERASCGILPRNQRTHHLAEDLRAPQRDMLALFRYPTTHHSQNVVVAAPDLRLVLVKADFCNWYGVTCFVKPGGVQNLAIRLPSNSLVGQIPASWARLCTLAQLDIRDNFLGGNLPAFGSVMAFPDLAYAIMSTNAFEGPLPAYYGRPPTC